ncbi:MAG: hypothetical protein KDJ37_11055 [Hyphomicrobiaceae bacterium]|nr:hypothetical protein [Hyphomicrobiaceae bacterium]
MNFLPLTFHSGLMFVTLVLLGCGEKVRFLSGELSRQEAKRILDNEGRGNACQATLKFVKGGLDKAKANGSVSEVRNPGGWVEKITVATMPGGGHWKVQTFVNTEPIVVRDKNEKMCLPGAVEITAIADAPFAPSSGSYKFVEFTEIVRLPPELQKLGSFVYTQYRKSTTFQKTDVGWRVAR